MRQACQWDQLARSARAAVIVLAAALHGCGTHDTPDNPEAHTLTAWFHAGRAAERRTLERQIARFNAGHTSLHIDYTVIPEGAYNGQVQAAALAGDLPDLLEFDGPYVYNYAWQGKLQPIGELVPADLRKDIIASIIDQGTYEGRLYSLGIYDSGLGIYARRSALREAGLRVPESPSDAWTAQEFERVLEELAKDDPDGAVLDLKLNYGDEWYTYGFSPLLRSAGGDLIDRSNYRAASGTLDSAAAVRAMETVQSWIQRGFVDPNLDDAAFVEGRVALSWVGHWEYPRYHEAVGDDLVVVPLPDFGHGTRTGQGSWNWGITTGCRRPEAAMAFLAFLLQPRQVLAMTRANGAVPATHRAIARSPLYGPDGPLRLFARQLTRGYAVPRPRTPAYPVISSAFAQAFRDIRNGAEAQATLSEAATVIDRDIRDNHGYPPPPEYSTE